jgi:hypothetical protein
MKKIDIPLQKEIARYFCDKHPDRECFTEINTMCWYGSKFDMTNLKMNLCDECMSKFYNMVDETFGVKPKDDFI